MKKVFRIIKQEISEMILRCRFRFKNKSTGTFAMTAVNNFNKPEMYIGTVKHALRLLKRGIRLETLEAPLGKTACIGYCPKEQKWYGWSHRAIYGFGVGSKVKIGDCAFAPSSKEEFIKSMERWYKDDDMYKNVQFTELPEGLKITYDIVEQITENVMHREVIEPWVTSGKGEWEAKTIADARLMAIDFAESVG